MYHYNPMRGRKSLSPTSPKVIEQFKTVLILIMAAVIIAGAIYTIPAVTYRTEAHNFFLHRMITECGEAVNLASSLSRTAGSSSSDTLARIRSRIYAMQVINTLSVGLDGSSGYIISDEWFTTLNAQLDDYSAKLIRGMTTGEQATNLHTNLTTLYNQLDALD